MSGMSHTKKTSQNCLETETLETATLSTGVHVMLTELKEDGFGSQRYYECFVAEQLVDGEPSESQFCFSSV